MDDENLTQMSGGLRRLADFLESHPEAIDDWNEVAIVVARPLGNVLRKGYGKLEKWGNGVSDYFHLLKRFSNNVQIRWVQERKEVCQRVQVGVKKIEAVPEKIIVHPAQPAREEPIFEWQCPESLLETTAEQDAAAAAEAKDRTEPDAPLADEEGE